MSEEEDAALWAEFDAFADSVRRRVSWRVEEGQQPLRPARRSVAGRAAAPFLPSGLDRSPLSGAPRPRRRERAAAAPGAGASSSRAAPVSAFGRKATAVVAPAASSRADRLEIEMRVAAALQRGVQHQQRRSEAGSPLPGSTPRHVGVERAERVQPARGAADAKAVLIEQLSRLLHSESSARGETPMADQAAVHHHHQQSAWRTEAMPAAAAPPVSQPPLEGAGAPAAPAAYLSTGPGIQSCAHAPGLLALHPLALVLAQPCRQQCPVHAGCQALHCPVHTGCQASHCGVRGPACPGQAACACPCHRGRPGREEATPDPEQAMLDAVAALSIRQFNQHQATVLRRLSGQQAQASCELPFRFCDQSCVTSLQPANSGTASLSRVATFCCQRRWQP